MNTRPKRRRRTTAGSVSVPAGFLPSDISGLDLWLKADGTLWQDSGRTTPVTANNDPVGAQDDASGGSKHATQATAGLRPVYKTNIQNSLPGILYTIADGSFLTSSSAAAQEPVTLFAVVQVAALATTQSLFGASVDAGMQWRVNATTGTLSLLSQATAAIGTSSTGLVATTTAIVAATYAANGAFAFYLNGAADGTGTVDRALVAGDTRIGSDLSNSELLGGYLFEQLKYDSILSAGNIASVFTYLNTRWAVY